ncbi:MAG: magnesium transporter CorA family protein [Clostridia bacterium]|nr:magnesium transporter CorA family protein [Clostridia bacterium]
MLKLYNTEIETGKLKQIKDIQNIERGTWINMIAPTEKEIQTVATKVNIQEDFIRYALDSEEKARIDIEEDDNTILFIIDTPVAEKEGESIIYTTLPFGIIIVRDDYVITVSLNKNSITDVFEKGKLKTFATYKKSRFIFQILYQNAVNFLTCLRQINKETEIAESGIKKSMRNKELIKMLELEKTLVYFTTSLKSNEIIMERTAKGKILKLYDDDEDILDDAIIENRQALEMTQIYSNILNTTMDACASIISNNLNGVMKFLTSITIVLSIPTMISSFWGMNVELPFQDFKWGFPIMLGISIALTLIVTYWLQKKDMLK